MTPPTRRLSLDDATITPRKNEYVEAADYLAKNVHFAHAITVPLPPSTEDGVSWTNNSVPMTAENGATMTATDDAEFVATITPRKNLISRRYISDE